jgi:hypothetical protein
VHEFLSKSVAKICRKFFTSKQGDLTTCCRSNLEVSLRGFMCPFKYEVEAENSREESEKIGVRSADKVCERASRCVKAFLYKERGEKKRGIHRGNKIDTSET